MCMHSSFLSANATNTICIGHPASGTPWETLWRLAAVWRANSDICSLFWVFCTSGNSETSKSGAAWASNFLRIWSLSFCASVTVPWFQCGCRHILYWDQRVCPVTPLLQTQFKRKRHLCCLGRAKSAPRIRCRWSLAHFFRISCFETDSSHKPL